jgi:hypothetical protein
VAGGGPGGQEVGPHGRLDRPGEVLQRHLQQRQAVPVVAADGVEADVDAAGPGGDVVGVGVDGPLVERVDRGRLDRRPVPGELGGHLLEGGQGPAGEKDPGALAGEGGGNRPADRSRPAVDHGVPALQQHAHPLSRPVRDRAPAA